MFEKFISILGSLVFSISGFFGFPLTTQVPDNALPVATTSQSGIDSPTVTHSSKTTVTETNPTYIGICQNVFKSQPRNYYEDRNKIYVDGEPLDHIDAASFKLLQSGDFDGGAYAKDKNAVYYSCKGEVLKGADPATIQVVGQNYVRDASHVYYYNSIIDAADPNTFTLLGGTEDIGMGLTTSHIYSKDKNHVYHLGQKIDGADPATFQILGYAYAKDKSYAYISGDSIKDADLATFTALNDTHYAKDKNHVYLYGYDHSGIVEGVNPANCTVEETKFRGACNPNELGG